MTRTIFTALFVFLCASPVACAKTGMPVMIGGSGEVDACGAVGQVKGLRANGDGFLAVRNGPGPSFGVVDKVHNGQLLYLCDSADGGKWWGVVYSTGGDDCGVTTPIPKNRSYSGRCKVGWVRASWVEVVAG